MPSTVSKSNARPSMAKKALMVLLSPIAVLWEVTERAVNIALRRSTLRATHTAFLDGSIFSGVLGKVLTLIVVFAILGGVATSFFTNLKTLVTSFNNTTATGNTTVDGFISVFGLVVAILGVFALIKLVQRAAGGSKE